MPAILDIGTQLVPAGLVSATQDFPAIQAFPRTLPTCMWVVAVTVPPVGAATFLLGVSATQNGTFATIGTLVWPAGLTGSRQVAIGASASLARFASNQSLWIRVSATLAGQVTMGGSWLTKPSAGGAGLGSRSYGLDNINAF